LAWIIDPAARTIAVFEQFSAEPSRVLHEVDVLDGGATLPGFSIALARLFAELP
jgi:Uma2 family endonuclease